MQHERCIKNCSWYRYCIFYDVDTLLVINLTQHGYSTLVMMYKSGKIYRIDVFLSRGSIQVRKTLPKRWKTFRGVMAAARDAHRINPTAIIVRECPTYKEFYV